MKTLELAEQVIELAREPVTLGWVHHKCEPAGGFFQAMPSPIGRERVLGNGKFVGTCVTWCCDADDLVSVAILVHEVAHGICFLTLPEAVQQARFQVAERARLVLGAEAVLSVTTPPAVCRWWENSREHDAGWFIAAGHLLWRLELQGLEPPWPVTFPVNSPLAGGVGRWRRAVHSDAVIMADLPLLQVLNNTPSRAVAGWLKTMGVRDDTGPDRHEAIAVV